VEEIDTSCTIMGRKSALPLILSPTALQRVFHWQGERAVARAAEKFGLWCGISSLATVSIEEIAALTSSPKMFQLYVHKDKGLNPR
jgi:L-lactate dehydrogenase (cytochrome)